jgi:hypothetical protein
MIEIMLGGEPRQLATNMGALRQIKEITKKDPFKWVSELGGSGDSFDAIETVIMAGLRAGGEKVKTEDVKKWIDELSAKDCIQVLTDFTNATFGVEVKDEPGEVKTPMHK